MKPAEIMGKVMALSDAEYIEFKALLKNYEPMRAPMLMASFKPGDKIKFNGGPSRGIIIAEVKKYGIKNLKARELSRNGIKSEFAPMWTVSPSMCTKVAA